VIAAAMAGSAVAVGLVLAFAGLARSRVATPAPAWRRRLREVAATARRPDENTRQARRRIALWCGAGAVIWMVTGWPVTGIAVAAGGIWLPWLFGSARIVAQRIERLEALEGWCRRMADTLAGGGAVGLAQAVVVSADHVDEAIAGPVRLLARRLRDGSTGVDVAVRAFADALDDRVADTVAAAILLALRQQSAGVARVLRQLADGVARDVRARRDIEAARAESRQSLRMLLVIQAAVLVMLALVPTFAAPYGTPAGQLVMAALLAATAALLVWMRRLALGRRSPRFLGAGAAR
jgi:tight adherence protein B